MTCSSDTTPPTNSSSTPQLTQLIIKWTCGSGQGEYPRARWIVTGDHTWREDPSGSIHPILARFKGRLLGRPSIRRFASTDCLTEWYVYYLRALTPSFSTRLSKLMGR